MKPIVGLLVAALLAIAPVAFAPPAFAAGHPRVTPLDCRTLVSKIGANRVWQAAFAGSRGGPGTWEIYERTHAIGCFRTYADCFNWLYWEQSDWPHDNSVGRCRRGTPYGF